MLSNIKMIPIRIRLQPKILRKVKASLNITNAVIISRTYTNAISSGDMKESSNLVSRRT